MLVLFQRNILTYVLGTRWKCTLALVYQCSSRFILRVEETTFYFSSFRIVWKIVDL